MLLTMAVLVGMCSSGFAMQMMDWGWIQQKADHGDVEAMLTLAQQSKDPNQAETWYRRAANSGSSVAEFWMGQQYLPDGRFGDDVSQATQWFTQAANQGYYPAKEALSKLQGTQPTNPWDHIRGVPMGGGEPVDRADRLEMMAERGDVEAMYELGMMLFNGGAGSNHDERAAFVWFQKSANRGNSRAMHQLAQMYGRGIGVHMDINQARHWDMEARRHGGY